MRQTYYVIDNHLCCAAEPARKCAPTGPLRRRAPCPSSTRHFAAIAGCLPRLRLGAVTPTTVPAEEGPPPSLIRKGVGDERRRW